MGFNSPTTSNALIDQFFLFKVDQILAVNHKVFLKNQIFHDDCHKNRFSVFKKIMFKKIKHWFC